MTLRVMTWNLWWRFGPWQARQQPIAAVVAEQDPDVVLLQEVWGADGTSAAHVLAEAVGGEVAITDDTSPRGGVGFHNAIISRRWPLGDVESRPLPAEDGRPGHRRVLSANVTSPWGPWPFVTTHLDHRFDQSATRQRQVAFLMDIIAARRGTADIDLPAVIGGDFNAIPDTDEIRMMTGRSSTPVPGLVLSDCWEQVGEGPGATWRSDNPYQESTAWPNRRLDYVFVSWPRPKPVGNPVGAHLAGYMPVDGVWPSDHAAVVVDLVTPRDPP